MKEPSLLTENSTANVFCYCILPHATRSHPSVLEVYEQELVLEVPPLAAAKQHNSSAELGRGMGWDQQAVGSTVMMDHRSVVRRYGADCVLSPLHDVNKKTLRPLFEGVRQGSNVSLLFASAPPPTVTYISGGGHSNMSNGTSDPQATLPPLPSSLGDESVAVHLRLLSGLLPALVDEAARTFRGNKMSQYQQQNNTGTLFPAADCEETFSLQCSASVFEVRVAPNASNQPRANGSNGALQQGVLVARDLLFNPTTAVVATSASVVVPSLPYSIVPQLGHLSEVQFTIDCDFEEEGEIAAPSSSSSSACEGLWGEIMDVFRVERLASSAKNAMRTRSTANTQTRRNYLSNSDLTVSDPSKSAFFVLVKLGNWGPSILIGDVGHDPQLLHIITACISVASSTSSEATIASIGKNLVGTGQVRDAVDHLHRRSLLHELLIPFFCPTASTTNPLSSLMRVSAALSLIAAKPTRSIVSSIICVPNLITRMEESVRLLGFVSEVYHSSTTTLLKREGETAHNKERMPTLHQSIQRDGAAGAIGKGARDRDSDEKENGETAGGQELIHVPTRMMQEGEETREKEEEATLSYPLRSQHKQGGVVGGQRAFFDSNGGDAQRSFLSLPAASSSKHAPSSSPVAVVVVGPTHQTNISIDGSATQHYSFYPSSHNNNNNTHMPHTAKGHAAEGLFQTRINTSLWTNEESVNYNSQQHHSHSDQHHYHHHQREERGEEALSPSLSSAALRRQHRTIPSTSDWRSELLVDYQLDDERRRSNGIMSGHNLTSSLPTDTDRAKKEEEGEEGQREDDRVSLPSRPPPPPKNQSSSSPLAMSSPPHPHPPFHHSPLYHSRRSTIHHHNDDAAKTGLERIAAETTPQPAERKKATQFLEFGQGEQRRGTTGGTSKNVKGNRDDLFIPKPFEEIVIDEGGDENAENSRARDPQYRPQSLHGDNLHSSPPPPPPHALRSPENDGVTTREGSLSERGYADLRAAAVSARRTAEQKEAKKAPSPPISTTFRAASCSPSSSSSDSFSPSSRSGEERAVGEVRKRGEDGMSNENTREKVRGKGKGDMMRSSPHTPHHSVSARRSPSVPHSRIEVERAASYSGEGGGVGGHERREGNRKEVFVDDNKVLPQSSNTFLHAVPQNHHDCRHSHYDHHYRSHSSDHNRINHNSSSVVGFTNKNNNSSNELQHVIHALRAQLRQTASRLRVEKEESYRKRESNVGNDELKQRSRGGEKLSMKAINKSSNRGELHQLQQESSSSGTAGTISVPVAAAGVGSLGDMSDIVDTLYKRIGDMEIMYDRDLQIMRSIQKENELLRRENELLATKSKELEKSVRDMQKKEISRLRKNALDRIYTVGQVVAATGGEERNDSGENSNKNKTMATIRRTPSHTFAAHNLALRESLVKEQADEIKVLKRKTHNLERENETLRRKCGLPTTIMEGDDDDDDAHKYGSTTDIFAALLRRGGSRRQDLVGDSSNRSRSPSASMQSSSAKPSSKQGYKENGDLMIKAAANDDLFASIAANLGVQSSEGKRLSNFIQKEMNKVREQLRKAQEQLVDVEGERDELKRMLKSDDPSTLKMSDHVSFVANAMLKGCSRMAAMLTAIEAKVREKDFIARMREKSAPQAASMIGIGGPNNHHDHSMDTSGVLSDDHSKLLLSVAQHRDAISRLEASVKEIISRTSSAAAVLGVGNGNGGEHVDVNHNGNTMNAQTAISSSSSDAGAMDYLLTFEVERLSALRAFVPTYAHIAKGADQLRSYL